MVLISPAHLSNFQCENMILINNTTLYISAVFFKFLLLAFDHLATLPQMRTMPQSASINFSLQVALIIVRILHLVFFLTGKKQCL